MVARSVPLSSNDLDSAIDVLASAGQALKPTRRERWSYRALMISADVAMASIGIQFPIGVVAGMLLAPEPNDDPLKFVDRLFASSDILAAFLYTAIAVSAVAVVVGIVSLALNVPLFREAQRNRAKLEERGLSSLSRVLWKQTRRSQWVSRIRAVLLVTVASCFILDYLYLLYIVYVEAPDLETFGEFGEKISEPIIHWTLLVFRLLFVVLAAALLFGARYLRQQRERMDLTASAAELRKALQSLRQHAGAGKVSVPLELLERTAKIESAQIATERKVAVLQSFAFRPNAYAITFDENASAQRTKLDALDRVDLEDLVAQLSTEGAPLNLPPGAARDSMFLGTASTKRVEVDYSIDKSSRGIRIVDVRPVAFAHGGGHG
jgi:hypothetical protein